MASKSQLQRELVEYDRLKTKLAVVVGSLNKGGNDVNNIKPTIENHYSVNESGNTAGIRAKNLADNILETSNYVKNTIFPAIDEKIEEIKREIKRIEEEEARRAREAAERRASSIRFRWW